MLSVYYAPSRHTEACSFCHATRAPPASQPAQLPSSPPIALTFRKPLHPSSNSTLTFSFPLPGAALTSRPVSHPSLSNPDTHPATKLILRGFFAVVDTLRSPAYAIPFLINVTGSVWFFLLIGSAELSLMVPIVNSEFIVLFLDLDIFSKFALFRVR